MFKHLNVHANTFEVKISPCYKQIDVTEKYSKVLYPSYYWEKISLELEIMLFSLC